MDVEHGKLMLNVDHFFLPEIQFSNSVFMANELKFVYLISRGTVAF